MYIKKSKFNEFILKAMVISLFLFPYYFRVNTLKDLSAIKLIFIVLLPIFLIVNLKKINKLYFCLISFIAIYISINNIFVNGNALSSNIRTLSMCVIPMYLLTIDLKLEKDSAQKNLKMVLSIVNIFTIVIFIIGIIDPLINYKIMGTIGNILNNKFSEIIAKGTTRDIYRYSSYLGHYLFTKDIFLYFYILNTCYYKNFKEHLLSRGIIITISLVGVLLTASKSGVIILLLMLLFVNYKRSKIMNMLLSSLMIIVTYLMGFFDTFLIRIKSGSLTTGRYEAWNILEYYNVYTKKIFFGYGEYYIERAVNIVGNIQAVAAFEYPIKILMYKYGIFVTILMIIALFIWPIMKFIKSKSYATLLLFVFMVININTYNGLVLTPDNMIFFSIFTMMLINCCKYEYPNDAI